MLDHDLHAEGAAARHPDHPSPTDRPDRCADRHREVLPGVPVRPPLSAAAEARGHLVRLHGRDPRARAAHLWLVDSGGTAAAACGDRRVRLALQLPPRLVQLPLDVLLQLRELGVASLQVLPCRLCRGLVRGQPRLGPAALVEGVADGQLRLREDPLTAHQLVRAVGEDDLRGQRHPTARAVLGACDTAQALVEHGDLPPLAVEKRLVPLGLVPLRLGLLPHRLVLPRRHRRFLVQPRHLSADAGGAVARRVIRGAGGAGHEGRECAQQHQNDQRMAAR